MDTAYISHLVDCLWSSSWFHSKSIRQHDLAAMDAGILLFTGLRYHANVYLIIGIQINSSNQKKWQGTRIFQNLSNMLQYVKQKRPQLLLNFSSINSKIIKMQYFIICYIVSNYMLFFMFFFFF